MSFHMGELPQQPRHPDFEPSALSDAALCDELSGVLFNERRGVGIAHWLSDEGLSLVPYRQIQVKDSLLHLLERPSTLGATRLDGASDDMFEARTRLVGEYVTRLVESYAIAALEPGGIDG